MKVSVGSYVQLLVYSEGFRSRTNPMGGGTVCSQAQWVSPFIEFMPGLLSFVLVRVFVLMRSPGTVRGVERYLEKKITETGLFLLLCLQNLSLTTYISQT